MTVTTRLGLSALGALPIANRPLVRPGEVRPGIVHLGLGAFHRAHQAVYTEAAVAASGGNWGIIGVAPRSREILDRLREQDQLYSVLTAGGSADEARAVGILAGLGHAAGDPYGVVAASADPGIRIVSLTVTEKAYRMSDDDHFRAQLTGPQQESLALVVRNLVSLQLDQSIDALQRSEVAGIDDRELVSTDSEAFTRDVEDAWTAAYTMLSTVMIDATH